MIIVPAVSGEWRQLVMRDSAGAGDRGQVTRPTALFDRGTERRRGDRLLMPETVVFLATFTVPKIAPSHSIL